jgi:putative addiction module killer protein
MNKNIRRKVVTTRIVKDWIANLADQVGKAAINDRIDLLKQGNFGDIDSVKGEPGLFEMRINVGPGYRVYFGEFDGQVVVLILGGPEKTQAADMKKAGAALRWLQNKEAEEKAASAVQESSKVAGKIKSKRK